MNPTDVTFDFTPAVRAKVLTRDLNRCARCGRYQPEGGHLHHRKLRSQGGLGVIENAILLCPLDHHWVHSHVAASRAIGLIVPGWADPEVTPVLTWRGLLLLDVDGDFQSVQVPSVPSEW